jgi:hypothetical protein
MVGNSTKPVQPGTRSAVAADGSVTGLAARTGQWWTSPWFIVAVSLVSTIPLLIPALPPLVDVPGHMGRYAVQLGLGGPAAVHWYDFKWNLFGNLGVDLLVQAIAPVVGLESAVKIIVTLIPALQVAGFLLVAREIHGRMPPTAALAAPLAYSFPFQFGFINFSLSAGLAFLALALWIRLGNEGRYKQRAFFFIPISLALWLTHIFGLGMFGVLAFAVELWRLRSFKAVLHCLVLVVPFGIMLATHVNQPGNPAIDWFNWTKKWEWLQMILRDKWEWFDKGSVVFLTLTTVIAMIWKHLKWWGPMAIAALIFAVLFVLLPRILLGSAYADMRLSPYILATALLSIGPAASLSVKAQARIAVLALAFFGIRTAATTVNYWQLNETMTRTLAVLPQIPRQARLMTFVMMPCGKIWAKDRLEHVPSMALVRRQAFANDQWLLPGAQLLRVKFLEGSRWTNDPSQLTTMGVCRLDWRPIGQAVATFPRQHFDYLWIVGQNDRPPYDAAGLQQVWRAKEGILYRITKSTAKDAPQ